MDSHHAQLVDDLLTSSNIPCALVSLTRDTEGSLELLEQLPAAKRNLILGTIQSYRTEGKHALVAHFARFGMIHEDGEVHRMYTHLCQLDAAWHTRTTQQHSQKAA